MRYSKQQKQLHNSIELLQLKKEQHLSDIKQQFKITTSRLKPAAIIKRTTLELFEEPKFSKNFLNTIISVIAGTISKKALVGKSNSIIKSIIGYIVQLSTTKMVAQKMKDA